MMMTWFWLGIQAKEEETVVSAVANVTGVVCRGFGMREGQRFEKVSIVCIEMTMMIIIIIIIIIIIKQRV